MNRLYHSLVGLLLLALPTTAAAADHELSFELGSTGHGADDNWFLFSDYRDNVSSLGLRAGYAVHDRVAVIAGWQHGSMGSWVEMPGFENGDWDDDYDSGTALGAAYYSDTFTLGAKADWPVAVWFRPYATLQAEGIRTLVRLDDDPGDDENLNQIERAAFSPGGAVTGGLDFRVPIKQGAWALASHIELGYHLATPAQLDELGTLANRGLIFRWGVGARF